MKPTRYPACLSAKLENRQREAIIQIAEQESLSIGEATRMLLDEGIKALGKVLDYENR